VAKEFRYLRILKVRTVVYERFPSWPRPLGFAASHRTDVSLYTSSYDFAETCVFSKQSLRPISCYATRSLESVLLLPKLRSHVAEFLREPSSIGLGARTPVPQSRIHTMSRSGLLLAPAA